jgi:cyclic pyranopterin monophosphate synthase
LSEEKKPMTSFTHIDEEGRVRMVDVTEKAPTMRRALARGRVMLNPKTFELIAQGKVKKGNVLETARIAGIMGAKKTASLIPMCHPIDITHVVVDFYPEAETHSIRIEAGVRTQGSTGVEIEALTAVSIAALTIYDMCKSYDRGMVISDILLVEKSGGKSGTFQNSAISGDE